MSSTPRADHILNHVTILDTMLLLKVISEESDAVRNIPCPFHNFGRERRPSGKVYVESDDCPAGRFYCFTCQKTWNPIDFVREYKRITFAAAMKWLESHFKVPPIKIEDFLPTPKPKVAEPKGRSEIELTQTLHYADSLLRGLRGNISLETFRLLCDITDALYVKARTPSEDTCRQVDKLLLKLKGLGHGS